VRLEDHVLREFRNLARRRATVKLVISASLEHDEPLPQDISDSLLRFEKKKPVPKVAASDPDLPSAIVEGDHVQEQAGEKYTSNHLPLDNLVPWERVAIARSALLRLGPGLPPPARDHVTAITSRGASGSPLFIVACAHASRFLAADPARGFPQLDELPEEVEPLFEATLRRLEAMHGRPLVEAMVMQLLAHPRGLSEGELSHLLSQVMSPNPESHVMSPNG